MDPFRGSVSRLGERPEETKIIPAEEIERSVDVDCRVEEMR